MLTRLPFPRQLFFAFSRRIIPVTSHNKWHFFGRKMSENNITNLLPFRFFSNFSPLHVHIKSTFSPGAWHYLPVISRINDPVPMVY